MKSATSWAAEQIRETVIDCVRASASCFDHVVMGVSGGLDSSIVAACLANEPKRLRCYTMVGPNANGDERHYARALTERFGISLHECPYRLDDIDLAASSAAHLARPIGPYLAQAIERASRGLHDNDANGAYFTGNGGDSVFCYTHSVTPVVDRYLAHGIRRGLWDTIRDMSDVTEVDVWEIMRAAWRRTRSTPTDRPVQGNDLFLRPDALAMMGPVHDRSWFGDRPTDVVPGKGVHASLIQRGLFSIDGFARSTGPVISPLLAQPVMETVLPIPTWWWCSNGINRALPREGFKDMLPDAILRRTSKGGPGGFLYRLYRTRKPDLGEILEQGWFASEQVVDVAAALAALRQPSQKDGAMALRILTLASVEAWARSWQRGSGI